MIQGVTQWREWRGSYDPRCDNGERGEGLTIRGVKMEEEERVLRSEV